MLTYFVSGHLDLTKEEFNVHYVPCLREALKQNNVSFVVGDAKGADSMAQDYLSQYDVRVTVFHMFAKPRYAVKHFNIIGGFKSDDESDAAMTSSSNVDIAWVRPGREKSGTAKNLDRRNKKE